MRVVSTFSAPSSVQRSVKGKLDTSEFDYLVVSYSSKLEVFALQPEGARLQCSLEIWGVISSLAVVHHTVNNSSLFPIGLSLTLPQDAPDTLLVTTETPDPLTILLEYVPAMEGTEPCLREYDHMSLRSSHSRSMEFFEGAVVHPGGDVAIVATYIGKLKALVMKGTQRKRIKAEFDCMLVEFLIILA